jgi:hypothetical protein
VERACCKHSTQCGTEVPEGPALGAVDVLGNAAGEDQAVEPAQFDIAAEVPQRSVHALAASTRMSSTAILEAPAPASTSTAASASPKATAKARAVRRPLRVPVA